MVLAVNEAYNYIRHALGGGEVPIELDHQQILNRAADYLYGMHPWRWSIERTALLDTRGKISITDGTWTAASNTLTSVGAFTNYTFVVGDQIEIESGTGATTGHYEVSSKTDSDNIVLASSLSSSNLATGDINAELRLPTVALPSDFRDIIALTSTDALLYGVELVSHAQIIRNRTAQIEVTTSWDFQAAVVYSGSPPVPILDLWPTPASNGTGVFTLSYRRKWDRVTTDNTVVDIPEFMEMLFIEILMAYTEGVVRRDDAGSDERLYAIMNGPIAHAAKSQDGLTQPEFGPIRGGGPMVHGARTFRSSYKSIPNVIGNPS